MNLNKLEEKLKNKRDIYDIKQKYKTKKIQTSKLLAFIILGFMMLINAFFVFYIVPQSGNLGITEYAFTAVESVLIGLNASIFTFLVSFLIKSGWETHAQAKDENESAKIDNDNSVIDVVNSVKDAIDTIKSTISSTTT